MAVALTLAAYAGLIEVDHLDRLAAGIQNPMFGIHHQSTFTVDKN